MRDGGGEYTVEAAAKEGRGTDVVLHLREGEDELLSDWKLKEIVRKYSDHIAIPIVMKKVKWDKEKSAEKITDEDETINQASALWARPKSEISEEQYQEFYKHVAHDRTRRSPTRTTASRAGRSTWQLLYIPRARRSTCGTGTSAGASSSTCGASSSWTTPSSCCRVPALRARRDRLERSSAQHLARDPAGEPRHRGDPRRLHQARPRPARRPRRNQKDKYAGSGRNSGAS